jgi:hypothetical protein
MSGYQARGEAMTGGVGEENDSTRGHAPAGSSTEFSPLSNSWIREIGPENADRPSVSIEPGAFAFWRTKKSEGLAATQAFAALAEEMRKALGRGC